MFTKIEKEFLKRIEILVGGAKLHYNWAPRDITLRDFESYEESKYWYERNLKEIKELIDGFKDKTSWMSIVSKHPNKVFEKAVEIAGDFYGTKACEYPEYDTIESEQRNESSSNI